MRGKGDREERIKRENDEKAEREEREKREDIIFLDMPGVLPLGALQHKHKDHSTHAGGQPSIQSL